MGRCYRAVLIFLAVLVLGDDGFVERTSSVTVTYDRKALVIDGRRRLLFSGSIHYPRSTPEMWPELIRKSKEGGLDVIETYVFWNYHEPVRGQYYFQGRFDLVRFVKTVQQAGLFVHLRIGPYACAEWNYGGFPIWLHFIPGIQFRTTNTPFQNEMLRFLAKIVNIMKDENLFASQGGPIILSQVENEYGNVEWAYGIGGILYVNWAASVAVALNTTVPWVMCQQEDAPDPVINTCNGFYCDRFTPNSPSKPKMWTENYSGWFLSFGYAIPFRPVEDLAFSVARFFETGGTFQNYYMYFGGTNFGRTAGGPLVATSYDYDAPIDEYENMCLMSLKTWCSFDGNSSDRLEKEDGLLIGNKKNQHSLPGMSTVQEVRFPNTIARVLLSHPLWCYLSLPPKFLVSLGNYCCLVRKLQKKRGKNKTVVKSLPSYKSSDSSQLRSSMTTLSWVLRR